MIEIFIKGGPIMWPLLALSLIAFTVVLERLVFIVMEKWRWRPNLVGEILTLVERDDPDAALLQLLDQRDRRQRLFRRHDRRSVPA